MRTHQWHIAVALAVLLTVSGCTVSGSDSTSAAGPEQARQELELLTVAAPQSMAGYSRERFPHWSMQSNVCNTREYVLKRDGTEVRTDERCRVISGRWLSVYDDKTVTDPATLDVDHVVALANAWRSGASRWTDEQRAEFGNDIVRPQLFAVSRSVNRAKGDQDPSQWKPPNRSYRCQYAQNWIAVKRHWQLTVTEAEKGALADLLGTCPWQSSAPATSPPVPAAR